MIARRKKISSALLALIFILAGLWWFCGYHVPILFDILTLKFIDPISTSFMRQNSVRPPFKQAEYHWVDTKDISRNLQRAVIIAEDDAFFNHNGLDWIAIRKAAQYDWKKKRFARGASTITQQLIKNLYLSPSKDPIRKFREMVLAMILDGYLSKDRILEIYLNVVEFGPKIYGAEAASQHYFKRPAKNLSSGQAAFLASILPNPLKLGKRGYHISRRGSRILNRIQ